MIAIHGRGAGAATFSISCLPRAAVVAYLAPKAANRTWYPLSVMAPTEQNEPWLTSALGVLRDLVADVRARGVPSDRIVLLGFSQGACLSSEFAVRHPARYGGLVLFSGGLVGPPGTTWSEEPGFGATPAFLGCSDVDAHVPKTRVDESAAVFTRMGADVTERINRAGHMVNDDEIAFARRVMDRIHNP